MNSRDILDRANHRKPPSKPPGAFRWNRSWYKNHAYTFFSTDEQRQIWNHISFSSTNLIYMIQCNKLENKTAS